MLSGKLEVFSTCSLNHGITKAHLQLSFLCSFQGFLCEFWLFGTLLMTEGCDRGRASPQSVPVDSSSRVLLSQPLHGRVEPQVLLRGEVQPQGVLLGAVPQEFRSLVLGASSISPLHQHLHKPGWASSSDTALPSTRGGSGEGGGV